HDDPRGFVAQDYLGVDKQYYVPTQRGYEQRISQFLAWIQEQKDATPGTPASPSPNPPGDTPPTSNP
ncbi:MAG: hypothetical protein IT441_06055, partial [Phycisphaeraceae bacterium]|nr:hypothetical protein [Phycisphaeraceae bacterium]